MPLIENSAQLALTVIALGGALGLIFGAVAHKTHFCAMGAVSDIVNMGAWARMRMWLLAIAVAVAGANALDYSGLVDLSRSFYTVPRFPWLAYIVGGVLFGIGMTLASGCGSRNLVRLGGGNLKALVVLVFLAISADMTLRGVLAPVRVEWLGAVVFDFAQGQDLSWLLAPLFGAGKRDLQPWICALIVSGLLAFVFRDRDFRADRNGQLGGVVIGLVIVAGWFVTGNLGYLAEDPDTLMEAFVATRSARPESFSFVGPVANTLELLQFWTDKFTRMTFGVAIVLGTLAGSFGHAALTRGLHWESFASAADTRNHIIGGVLMGFGGVTAVGCTIGQGITGLSTLALGSILVWLSIVAGSSLTMVLQYQRMLRES